MSDLKSLPVVALVLALLILEPSVVIDVLFSVVVRVDSYLLETSPLAVDISIMLISVFDPMLKVDGVFVEIVDVSFAGVDDSSASLFVAAVIVDWDCFVV